MVVEDIPSVQSELDGVSGCGQLRADYSVTDFCSDGSDPTLFIDSPLESPLLTSLGELWVF